MSGPVKVIALAALVALVGWIAWVGVVGDVVAQRSDLIRERARLSAQLDQYESGLEAHRATRAGIAEFVDRTLGGDLETVDHRFRSRLNRIGEEIGLAEKDKVVNTPRTDSRLSPARSVFSRRDHPELRDEIDFVEVSGRISGEVTLEQALRLVHRIESEPWLKHITRVQLTPRDNGERFTTSVDVTTLFLPGGRPRERQWPAADEGAFARFAALASANPFRIPPPPKPAPSPTQPAEPVQLAADPPQVPWSRWRLTGVAVGPDGAEAWIVNLDTNESRRLAIGERLGDAELIAAAGEVAEFRSGEQRFQITVGKTLGDRTLDNQ